MCALTVAMVAGDRAAYVRLFELRSEFVEGEARKRLRRRSDLALDAAQETWIRVARAPKRCVSVSKLDAWLQRIVTNACIDLLRGELARQSREEMVARGRHEAQEFIDGVASLQELRVELSGLEAIDREERTLLELRARTGATLRQLAQICGLGRAGMDSRLRRAAEAARDAIDGGRA